MADTTESTAIVPKKKTRKGARVQVDPDNVPDENDDNRGGVYNIWYQQWTGGDSGKSYFYTKPALGRCDPKRDGGYTKADKVKGSHFCLKFAHGLCPKGKKCDRLHRLPQVEDIFPPSVDCFGRKKHATYKEDMSGVGSFLRQNRTLYVAKIGQQPNVEEAVSRHFSTWGEIDRIRVLANRQLAFITYMNENSAQFAKEAMNRQSLDGDEILTVKWAAEDPSAEAQQREKRRLEEQAAEAIRKMLPEHEVKELEGDVEQVKRRKIEGTYGLEGYEAPDKLWYAQNEKESEQEEVEEPEHEEDQKVIEGTPREAGLFNSSTLEGLKNLKAPAVPKPAAPKPSALVDYDSDDE